MMKATLSHRTKKKLPLIFKEKKIRRTKMNESEIKTFLAETEKIYHFECPLCKKAFDAAAVLPQESSGWEDIICPYCQKPAAQIPGALQTDPRNLDLLLSRAQYRYLCDNFEDSLADYDAAMKLASEDSRITEALSYKIPMMKELTGGK
jgi:hypothetical protein